MKFKKKFFQLGRYASTTELGKTLRGKVPELKQGRFHGESGGGGGRQILFAVFCSMRVLPMRLATVSTWGLFSFTQFIPQ